MLEFLILLPMIMVTILSMTFDVSVDELTNVSRGNYFSYDVSKDDYNSLERKVHHFYTRMLEDSENEIEDSKKRTKGQTCDIQAIQSMQRQCSCNQPRKSCVHIEPPAGSDNVIFTMPQCAVVERCEGICPLPRQCRPTAVDTIKIPVIYLNHFVLRGGGDVARPECTTITVEKHLKCSCSCSITKEDCSAKQVFNLKACRCECPQPPKEQQKCKDSGKEWDSFNCNCICPTHLSHMCSTGAFFHPELCRCIPIDRPTGQRRRRPPV